MLPRWFKPLCWVLCLAPLAPIFLMVVGLFIPTGPDTVTGWMLALPNSVNPIESMIRHLGDWALRFILLTLCLTPLRRLTGWAGWIKIRRLIGLFAFFYVSLHLLSYIVLDQFFDWAAIGHDIIKHPFITVGMLAFILLIPLAATSTQAAMKRLGRRWKQIHQLIYLIAPLGVLHFWWMVKADIREPAVYLIVLALLLGIRLWWRVSSSRK